MKRITSANRDKVFEANPRDLIDQWSREGESAKSIAQRLNSTGYADDEGKDWTRESVKSIRKNEGIKFSPETHE